MGLRQLVATKDIPRMLLPATKYIHRMQIMQRKPANAYLQDGVNVAPAELPDINVQDESGTARRDNCTTALSSQSVLVGASPDYASAFYEYVSIPIYI